VTLIEKEEQFGGLAVSRKRGENYYDLGVHMLHEHDPEIFEDVMGMMGDESIEVQLDARIRWAGSFYRYPLQFGDMIQGIPPLTLARCVVSLFAAQLRNKIAPWEPENCEEALRQLYGNELYRFFFEDFTHRYWGIHPRDISAMFVKRKMPRLTAVDAIKKALSVVGFKEGKGRTVESALLDETLHYAPTGAEAMPRLIAEQVRRDGGRLLPGCSLERVHLTGGSITGVTYKPDDGGESQFVECDHCISTVPVPLLISKIYPRPPKQIRDSATHLHYLPIVIYGLLVKIDRALDGLYVYYRDRVFHRVGEPKNAGLKVVPDGHTVLIVEMTCQIGDEKWTGAETFRERVYDDLEAESICKRDDVVEFHILRSEHGYPVFGIEYEPHHEAILDYFEKFPTLQSTGRQGGFCFPNMHSAMRMGAEAAERALDKG
ncbi:MAG: FAD-dependent oxidoreductase, partial [Verrucomicrobiales bacterium]